MKRKRRAVGNKADKLVLTRFLAANARRIAETRLIIERSVADYRTEDVAERLLAIFAEAQSVVSEQRASVKSRGL